VSGFSTSIHHKTMFILQMEQAGVAGIAFQILEQRECEA
jgi:hypothetical protein